MTSSGTYSYSLSTGEGVLAAFERIKIRAPSIRQEHMLSARREMNLLQAELSNRQVNLWKVELLSVSLTDGDATYDLPDRVVMVLDAYLSLNNGETDQTDRYLTPLSRTQYASFASKQTPGPPTSFWFNRQLTPELTTYPVCDADSTYVINYYACVQMQDATITGGVTPDVPYLWYDVLVAGMAYRLARIYMQELEAVRKQDYADAWSIAATQNTENVPMTVAPGIGRYYR
jgi:hypothetical protein